MDQATDMRTSETLIDKSKEQASKATKRRRISMNNRARSIFSRTDWWQEFTRRELIEAGVDGDLSDLQALLLKTNQSPTDVMDVAAENGHLEMVQWLHKKQTEGCTTAAMDKAAGNGHLNVVNWLHTNRAEGCTTHVMDQAAWNGHLRVVQWLHQNRTEGCTYRAMEGAVNHCYPRILPIVFGRPEMRLWPRQQHAVVIANLTLSSRPLSMKLLKYIARRRRERYSPEAVDNPVEYVTASTHQGLNSVPVISPYEKPMPHILMAIRKLCTICNLPSEIERRISEYIILDPREQVPHATAIRCGWVHWLLLCSETPNEDTVALAELGNMSGACFMHDHLANKGQLKCSKRFMFLTVEKGDFEHVKWHMRACGAHSIEEWLHAATWIGRYQVLAWTHNTYSDIIKQRKDHDRVPQRKRFFTH